MTGKQPPKTNKQTKIMMDLGVVSAYMVFEAKSLGEITQEVTLCSSPLYCVYFIADARYTVPWRHQHPWGG